MLIVPETRIGKIEFYEAHLAPWAANAAAIGLSAGSVAAQAARVEAARADYTEHLAAAEAARAATQKFHDSVAALHAAPGAGSDMIETIKTTAALRDDPDVFVLAQIPGPVRRRRPGSSPPPGTPTGFSVHLLQTGVVELAWKCKNPGRGAGTMYEIRRRVEMEAGSAASGSAAAAGLDGGWTSGSDSRGGPGGGGCRGDGVGGGAGTGADRAQRFEFLATAGVKTFRDETIPAGALRVTYEVTAIRSTSRGSAARYTIQFGGAAGAGAMTPGGGAGARRARSAGAVMRSGAVQAGPRVLV